MSHGVPVTEREAMTNLNDRAWRLIEDSLEASDRLGVVGRRVEGGGRILDCGVETAGGLGAGILLARLTLADLGDVGLESGEVAGTPCPFVRVFTDQAVRACMAAQYAGWQISVGDFFAIGSGPMRALYGGEELYDHIGCRENADVAVGALETRVLPSADVFRYVSEKTGIETTRITLAVAPTASLAGGLQVVARSVETALHKLHELGFDLQRIRSGFGRAPLPPPARDDLRALGRTNDAILYGAQVVLWVRGDDDSLAAVGEKTPSCASSDHGAPFAEIFARYDHDFYRIDPLLFSPAEITFHNLDSGRTHRYGRVDHSVLEKSFFTP